MDVSGRISVDSGVRVAADDAVLVADGVFLLKPVLNPHWDLRVYLDIDLADVQARGTDRDQAWMTSKEAAAERYRTFYVPCKQLYQARCARPNGPTSSSTPATCRRRGSSGPKDRSDHAKFASVRPQLWCGPVPRPR